MTPDNLAMFIRKYIRTILYMQAKKVTEETPKLTIIIPDSLISFHHCDKSREVRDLTFSDNAF